jgi:tryptophan 7-halogenase
MALQENRKLDRIAVVGGGTAGYVTTLFLCSTYPNKEIRWIYPEDNITIGVGEAIVPYVSNFMDKAGISIKDVIRECKGTLKLGIKFKDFRRVGHEFTFPFGIDAEESAKISKIMETGKIPNDMLDYQDISNHFDVNDLMSYMDQVFDTFDNLTVERRTVKLAELSDDMVIDCTGFSRNIFDDAAPTATNFVDISSIIPNNEALIYRADYSDINTQRKPFSTFTGMKSGWSWEIPMKDKIGIGYVFPEGANVEDEFLEYLCDYFDRDVKLEDLNRVPMKTGRNEEHIIESENQTVVSVGLSSFFIEPIESTGLYLVVRAIEMLKEYIDGNSTSGQFNEAFNHEFDTVLDFIIAHYKYSDRPEQYWKDYSNIESALFGENNLFPKEAWTFILGGFEQNPEGYDKLINNEISDKDLLNIIKGTDYNDWLNDESNFK